MITQVFQEWEDSGEAGWARGGSHSQVKMAQNLATFCRSKCQVISSFWTSSPLRTSYVERTPGVTVWVPGGNLKKGENFPFCKFGLQYFC